MSKLLKYSIITFFAIIVLLLTIPYWISLDNYKQTIATAVKEATGRDLTIDKKINLFLLPRPHIKLGGIKLSSISRANYPYLLQIEEAEATVALLPLLTGKIVIANVELNKPEINLEKLKSWDFTLKENLSSHENQQAAKNKTVKNKEPPFSIEQVKIKQGKIHYLDENTKSDLDNLNINLQIEDLKGPINFVMNFEALGENFNIEGKIKEVDSLIPITTEINALGKKVIIDGNFNTESLAFNGNLKASGNLKNLKAITKSELSEGLKQDYNLGANIIINKEQAALNDINFKIGEVKADGKINYSISKGTGAINLALNPGNININLIPGSSTDQLLTSKIQIQIKTIKPFLEALKIDISQLPDFLMQAFSFNANVQYKDQFFMIQDIALVSGSATLNGMVGLKDWVKKAIFPFDIRNNGTSIIKMVGRGAPVTLADVRLRGEVSKESNIIHANATITTAKADLNIKGNIDIKDEIKPSLTATINGINLGQTLQQLLGKPSNQNLGAFAISTNIDGDFKKLLKITLNKSTLVMGNETTTLIGKADINFSNSKPEIIADVNASNFNLNVLSNNGRNNNAVTLMPTRWSQEKIDLAGLQGVNGESTFTIQKITSESLIFDNLKAKMRLSDGVLYISSLNGNLYGGKFEGSGNLSSKANGAMNLKVALSGSHLKNIVPQNGKIKLTQGIVNFNSNLKSKGDSIYNYINNLSGEVRLNGTDGRLSGVNLQKIVDTLNNAKSLHEVLKALDGSFSNGEAAFKSLESVMSIENGIGNLTKCDLVANSAIVNAQGKIDLPKYLMDIHSVIKVEVKNLPPFNVYLYGSLDNPQHKLDTKALQQYLVNNVLTSVIDEIKSGKTRPEDILKGVIGIWE